MLELLTGLFRYQAWADGHERLFTQVLQTVLRSRRHRGQVAARPRAFGGAPPTVDYIPG